MMFNNSAQKLVKAAAGGSSTRLKEAFEEFAEDITNKTLAMHRAGDISKIRVLNDDEKQFYQTYRNISKVKSAASDLPLPESIITVSLFEMQKERPLLNLVTMAQSSARGKWILDLNPHSKGYWGVSCKADIEEIKKELFAASFPLTTLLGWIPVCTDILELSDEWVDIYIRSVLKDSLYYAFENGAINGKGINAPVGMIRDMAGSPTATEYPEKTAIAFNSFAPAVYGKEIAKLAVNEKDNAREINAVLMVVHPLDYLEKVFPAYVAIKEHELFPTIFIQSVFITRGKAILGIPKNYLFAYSGEAKVEFSSHQMFLNDITLGKAKLYAHGQPKDNNSFEVLDISGMGA